MDGVNIRIGQVSDLEDAAGLRWSWIAEENGTPGSFGRDTFVSQFIAWFGMHSESHSCFVAERDGEIVGMAWLAMTSRVPSPQSLVRSSGDLQSVYVIPGLRNRGIGSRLIQAVATEATTRGAERLVVHSSIGAVGAYARAGFSSSESLRDLHLQEHPIVDPDASADASS